MTEHTEETVYIDEIEEQEPEEVIPSKSIKVMVNDDEYTSIKKLVGDKTVSGAMRENFLVNYSFKYNDMPRVDANLRNEVIRCQKLVSGINRNLNKASDLDFKKAINVMDLSNRIYNEIDNILFNHYRKDLSEEEIEKASWQQEEKWLKKKSFIESERRTKTIRIQFTEEDYQLALLKAKREGKKLATAIREHFLSQGDFIINSVPKVHPSTYVKMVKVGDALSYVDEAFQLEVESGIDVDLDALYEVLNELLMKGLLPISIKTKKER